MMPRAARGPRSCRWFTVSNAADRSRRIRTAEWGAAWAWKMEEHSQTITPVDNHTNNKVCTIATIGERRNINESSTVSSVLMCPIVTQCELVDQLVWECNTSTHLRINQALMFSLVSLGQLSAHITVSGLHCFVVTWPTSMYSVLL